MAARRSLAAALCAVACTSGVHGGFIGSYSYWPEDQPTPESWDASAEAAERSGPPQPGPGPPAPKDGAPATAAYALYTMGVGVNLGDTFDTPGLNPSWLAFSRNKKMIDAFVEKGFTQVRIPVTWGGEFIEGSEFTNQITQAVDYALSKNLWVLIDTHHETWLKCCYDGSAFYNDKFTKLWRDIAGHFSNRSDHLLFGVLNEPEDKFGDWVKKNPNPLDASGQALTRQICNVGLAAIRSVSPTRIALCSPNAQGNVHQAMAVFPGKFSFEKWDDYIGVTLHTYDQWGFCGQDGSNGFWDVNTMKRFYDSLFNTLNQWKTSSGIPTHIGEFGVGRQEEQSQRNTDIVRQYYGYVAKSITQHNIPATLWDDGGWFALIVNFEWVYGLADAALAVAPTPGPPTPPTPTPSGPPRCCWKGCTECPNDSFCDGSESNCAKCGSGAAWCFAGSAPSPPAPTAPPAGPSRCCWQGCTACPRDAYCDGSEANCNNCGSGAAWCRPGSLGQLSNATVHAHSHVPPALQQRSTARTRQRRLRAQQDSDASVFLQESLTEGVFSEDIGEEL